MVSRTDSIMECDSICRQISSIICNSTGSHWLTGNCLELCCCCAVLRCAVLCGAVLCCAVLCCAVLWAGPSRAVLCCAVLCCAVLCRAVPCCAVPCRAVLCRAVPCCATGPDNNVWCKGGKGGFHMCFLFFPNTVFNGFTDALTRCDPPR